MFQLTRDLIFFDVETTGLNVVRDRILQIAMVKYFKDGSEPKELSMIINPGMPISEDAYKVHELPFRATPLPGWWDYIHCKAQFDLALDE